MDLHLPPDVAAFQSVLAGLSSEDWARVDAAAETAAVRAAEAALHWDFERPAKAVDAVLGPDASDDVRRGLIATWALQLSDRVAAMALPPEVLVLYPFWIEKLADFLTKASGHYEPDHWAKDVRFSLALSVPGGRSQILDLSWPMGMGETLRHVRDGHGVGALVNYVRHGAQRPWLQNHTESRWLDDFNPEGWDRMWRTAAAVLKTRPHLAGAMGASWFYDPQLETVSPRLNYLRAEPLKGGAWLVHQGPGDIHTERATATSSTRRALMEAGDYTPTSWLLAWPRKALIAWADRG